MADADIADLFPYPGKTKSRVWDYFKFRKLNNGPPTKANLDMDRVVCSICKKEYANKGNTTNLMFHLDNHHKETSYPKHQAKAQAAQPKIDQSIKAQSNPFLGVPARISKDKQVALDEALLQVMVAKVLPLSLVENDKFTKFVSLLDSRYKPPNRKKMMTSLNKTRDNMQVKIKAELRDCEGIGLTHDGWTSTNTESYNTTTVHYIDKDWDMKSAVLSTKKIEGSHTSEKIAETVREVVDEWKLPTDVVATTDNAANEVKAFELLGYTRFGCYGHRFNLVVKKALVKPDVAKLLGKGRRLVTLLHSSSSITDYLKEKQALLLPEGQVGHKLIADVCTRWNSSLAMLKRLVEQTPALLALASDERINKAARQTIKNCLFTFDETVIVEKLIEVLDPFHKATEILCADSIPTINKVLPVVVKLKRVLADKEDDPSPIKAVKVEMTQQLEKRTGVEEVALIGCVLSPFTKEFKFRPELKADADKLLRTIAGGVKITIKQEPNQGTGTDSDSSASLDPMIPQLPSLPSQLVDDVGTLAETHDSVDPPVKKKMKSMDTEDWLDDVVCVSMNMRSESNVIEAEITRYLARQLAEDDLGLTVLEWWKKNGMYFPHLAKVAKQYLYVQASSVPSERVFSLAGELVSKKRARLNPDNVDMLIFLNKNMKRFW